ncbi:macro domain-containing protein [Streptomyces noursei]|uniref:macro domain-containing protein n=1 Tax=Streptomyces noursei TaxID=1971 RepID=UPI000A8A84BA|nr:macro domain-containing protein [Streptomyces noursei]
MNRVRTTFLSRRGWRTLSAHFSFAFATLAGVVQLVLAVHPIAQLQGVRTIIGLIAMSCSWAIMRSLPRDSISREFKHPDFSVTVKVGDLFTEEADRIVGFTDTFDTSTDGGEVISPRSVQGQMLERVFYGDTSSLDAALGESLRNSPILSSETEASKPMGKRDRYSIGTVTVITNGPFKHYCVAYSRMSNDLIAQSSVDNLWQSLGNTWSTVASRGHLDPVAIPILGSDLARIGSLGRESLIKMIVLSFVARSRVALVSRRLSVVIHPSDTDQVNMQEMQAFLNSL